MAPYLVHGAETGRGRAALIEVKVEDFLDGRELAGVMLMPEKSRFSGAGAVGNNGITAMPRHHRARVDMWTTGVLRHTPQAPRTNNGKHQFVAFSKGMGFLNLPGIAAVMPKEHHGRI